MGHFKVENRNCFFRKILAGKFSKTYVISPLSITCVNKRNTNRRNITNSRVKEYLTKSDFVKTYLVDNLDGGHFETVYTNRWSAVDSWLEVHAKPGACLGFDTETKPTFRVGQSHPTATIQLASLTSCLVIQLTQTKSPVSPALIDTLSDPTIVKFGVQIDDDAIELYRHWRIKTNARADISGVKVGSAERRQGLKSLAEDILGIELVKKKKVTVSNWENCPLSDIQVEYAARDAWISRAMLEALREFDEDSFSGDAAQILVKDERNVQEMSDRQQVRKTHKVKLKSYQDSLQRCKELGEKPATSLRKAITYEKEAIRKLAPDKNSFDFDLEALDTISE
eukprot:CAMPEP_0196590244 /NCGR_PEP_ID=MMETSP1081-20130531/66064_1 /TAXON_ID=36882 /ORGANISM="Pyramimonas amylifera, Strain CCMP720" /LENGTH=338 /DNA_ID=CAMNT_0041913295 /DNA_START=92 /DNA_END=1106 /DNA_ORIENTATION=-